MGELRQEVVLFFQRSWVKPRTLKQINFLYWPILWVNTCQQLQIMVLACYCLKSANDSMQIFCGFDTQVRKSKERTWSCGQTPMDASKVIKHRPRPSVWSQVYLATLGMFREDIVRQTWLNKDVKHGIFSKRKTGLPIWLTRVNVWWVLAVVSTLGTRYGTLSTANNKLGHLSFIIGSKYYRKLPWLPTVKTNTGYG